MIIFVAEKEKVQTDVLLSCESYLLLLDFSVPIQGCFLALGHTVMDVAYTMPHTACSHQIVGLHLEILQDLSARTGMESRNNSSSFFKINNILTDLYCISFFKANRKQKGGGRESMT